MKKQSTHCDPILDNTSVFKNILRIYKKTNGHFFEYEEKYEHISFTSKIYEENEDHIRIWMYHKSHIISIITVLLRIDYILIKFHINGNEIKIDINEIDDIINEDETILILRYGREILNEFNIDLYQYMTEYEYSQLIQHFDEFTRTIEGLKL